LQRENISVLIRLVRWIWIDELIEVIPQRRKGAKAQRKIRVKDFDRITGCLIIGFNCNNPDESG
jgi:hypothetical protein